MADHTKGEQVNPLTGLTQSQAYELGRHDERVAFRASPSVWIKRVLQNPTRLSDLDRETFERLRPTGAMRTERRLERNGDL